MSYALPLIGIITVFFFSIAGSYSLHHKEFSTNIFLVSLVIGIGILIWIGIIPYYSAIISALIIIGMLLMEKGDDIE